MKSALYDRFIEKLTGEEHFVRISKDRDLGLFATRKAAIRRIAELSPNIDLNDKTFVPTDSGLDINGFWWAVYFIPNKSKNMEWHYEIRERDVFE